MNYNKVEKEIFEWLYKKHKENNEFTFSVRQKASKGSETAYFIGSEQNGHIGTTFWEIPIASPGAKSDLINLFFIIKNDRIRYKFQLIQTTEPHDQQNQLALDFIRFVSPKIKTAFPNLVNKSRGKDREYYEIMDEHSYNDVTELLESNTDKISEFVKLVSDQLEEFKSQHPDFKASRISIQKFDEMIDKMEKRQFQYGSENDNFTPNRDKEKEVNNNSKNSAPLNQILYGPPGTGKTYNTINMALNILGEEIEGNSRKDIKERFDELMKEGQIMFTTFHQSMSYEDFIEGIKPVKPSGEDKFLKYDVEDGIFKKLCLHAGMNQQSNFRAAYDQFLTQTAQQGNELVEMKTPSQKIFHVNVNSNDNLNLFTGSDKTKQGVLTAEKLEEYALGYKVFKGWQGYANGVLEHLRLNFNLQVVEQVEDKKYVLIIDEINRGNVSSIFGELITLIEEDKRQGKPEALEVILPYSKDKFSVPQNLYIIGTMNTADRSVEALDAALRRRFNFIEMPPRYDLAELKYEYEGIIVSDILRTINTRIEKLLDKDHQIGHSYFILGENETAEGKLINSFFNSIIPLLQEYFYGDYGKIGLVLGMGFVIKKRWNIDLDNFAKLEAYGSSDFDDRDVFGLVDYRDIKATHKIASEGNAFIKDFKNAINMLMNKSLG